MAKQRIREIRSTPVDTDYLRQRAEAGWRLVALEWERDDSSQAEDGRLRLSDEIPFGLRISGDCMHLEEHPDEKQVLLLVMEAPANWGADYRAAFHAIFPALAEQHHVLLYPFFLDGIALDPALNQPDGIHPNARGVEAIVDRVGPYVLRLLGAATAGNG